MPTHSTASFRNRRRGAFSLVEMIGVLAIIAILAVVIVPKVFSTIASSRVTNAVASISSIKSAVTDFAGKYGTIPTTNNNARIDDLLFNQGLLENRFAVKIGNQPGNPMPASAPWTRTNGQWTSAGGTSQTAQSRIICLTSNTTAPSLSNGRNFKLDGATDLPTGTRVVSAALVNIRASEALELSNRIDGEPMTETDTTTGDENGRVVYRQANAAGLTTAYVYVAHQ